MSEQTEAEAWNIRVAEAGTPLHPSHLRQPPSWVAFLREIDGQWRRYMLEHDSPEERLATKVQTRFRLDS